jgi:hypothetical protein
MFDGWRVSAALEQHTLPKRRVEVARKLRRAVSDEKLKGMLDFSVLAPRNRYRREMHPERCVDDRICMSTDSAHVGRLWWGAFSRLVQQPHAVIAELYVRIIVSLTGALYAVIARNLDGVFANAASASWMW